MREKTNIYFLAKITRGFDCGDCILIENIDSNGNITHALIDTGRQLEGEEVVCNFLKKHNVKKLAFLCITHIHEDHTGDTISVLENYKVDKLIVKEFDLYWSPNGYQYIYEDIIGKAIEKDIEILGVSFESLGSKEYSPSQTDNFKKIIKNAKKENFEFFNENNVIFDFGSAVIQLMNWEIFDSEGNLFVTGKNKNKRDIIQKENSNSLGLLIFQGDQKAFLPGDMNNIEKTVDGKKMGDEDRLKYEIGKLDFLKLGHHGHRYSNTIDYMNVVMPRYAIITNESGGVYLDTYDFLEKNKINYLYSTEDEYEVSATIYNDETIMGFGTEGLKRVNFKEYYIPEDKIYANYLKSLCPVQYEIVEKSVKNWEELKNVIEKSKIDGVFNDKDNSYIIKSLKINLEPEDDNIIYNADSQIVINNFKKIQLITNQKEIMIKRGKKLINYPLFKLEYGTLILGEENMKGKIIIDGNKDEMSSSSQLIQLLSSEFSMYDNVTLCNNLHKTSKMVEAFYRKNFGSAILSEISKINLYGGEITNNIHEIYLDENMEESILPEKMTSNYFFDSRGAGIYMYNSILNCDGGKIVYNEGINNSYIYSNKNSMNNNNTQIYSLNQNCFGTGIYAENTKIYLKKGEISNNITTNNSKIRLISPEENEKINLKEIVNSIYGSAIYAIRSHFEMEKDFIIQNNSSYLNTNFNIEKQINITSGIKSEIKGGQIHFNLSRINIQGGIIQDSDNISNVESKIEEEKANSISFKNFGGAIDFQSCADFKLSNLQIINCTSDNGGGIYFANSQGKISESEIKENKAKNMGGGIYMNSTSNLELYNTQIMNNSTEEGSGGGIYAYGDLTIDGENTSISSNSAGNYGGGLMIKNNAIINNGIISNNKANKSGGGIRNDGNLKLIKAKIYQNWCKEYGGGINTDNKNSSFFYNHAQINIMVYNNTAEKGGNNLYPEDKE